MRESYCLLPTPVEKHPRLLAAPSAAASFTPAERRVLEYLCAGCSNKEIAAILDKAEPTVKIQVASCLHKCGQPSRMRLMAALR